MAMRVLPLAGAATLVAAVSVLLAPVASATAPGDNGTIKIHDAKTGEELVKNEPHVCTFYLDAFHFDGSQQAAWKIVEMPPTGTKGELASSGAITLDAEGHGRTADMTLPDGHYKLEWNFDGEHGKAKQKVFWTDCTPASPTGTPSTSPSDAPSGSPSGTPSGSTSPSPGSSQSTSGGGQPSASTSGTAVAGASTSPSTGSGTGSLASTGASVVGITGVAALLLAVGAAVRFRRRGNSSPRH
jgi:hypothetical protein